MNRTWKFVRTALVLLVPMAALGANPADPETWNGTYEASPANTDNVSQGDDWMRQDKIETRRRVEVEPQIGSGTGPPSNRGDNGFPQPGDEGRSFGQEVVQSEAKFTSIGLDVITVKISGVHKGECLVEFVNGACRGKEDRSERIEIQHTLTGLRRSFGR